MTQEAIDQVTKIITEAAKLPLYDAAYALWCQKYRLDELEAQRHHPYYLNTTYRDARNHLAYMMK